MGKFIFPLSAVTLRSDGPRVGDVSGEGSASRLCRILVCAIELATYVIICYYGWVWVMRAHAYMQSIPWMQVKVAYAAIPISAFFMSCYALRDLILALRGRYDDFNDD